ncbi:hypothetical protein pdul_cds_903 [Pandoravirus dulcis]|uniref:Uncharacterized protein n=1 Tax=Pandoravirus dulcis TaxID=1349409 RepID=S4VZ46_9VIRU|nr:hypothetical protein pdul_cds_903 [Pandoravirus dulcis]AGO83134.1 hypothetical protein pdul_cds_903 [Pandoravirus dulcis]
MQCTLSLCPSFLHKTKPAPKRPREADRGPRRDSRASKRPRTAAVKTDRPAAKIRCRSRDDHAAAGAQRPPMPVERGCSDLARLSILLDYLGTLVADGQCEAFGVIVVIDGTHTCRLAVARALPRAPGLVWTLQSSSWSDVCAVTNTRGGDGVERTVHAAPDPSSDMPAIVDTRLPTGMGSDAATVSVVCRRWIEAHAVRGGDREQSRLWVRMNRSDRPCSVASTRALGVLIAGTDRPTRPEPHGTVGATLDQAWDNWNSEAIRYAAAYLHSISLALSAKLLESASALAPAHCLPTTP